MKQSLIIFTFLLLLSCSQNHSLSQTILNISDQKLTQQQRPLTLTQLEKLVRNPASNKKDAIAKDQAIATEIRQRGIAFYPTDLILENFRKLGAGPKTIQAFEDYRRRAENIATQDKGDKYKTKILVADFQGPELKNSSVTSTIIDELSEATRAYSDIEVIALNEPITAKQGRQWAEEKGKERGASIVLWGWYQEDQGQVLINVHFQLIDQSFGFLTSEKQTLVLPLPEFFNFQIRLSKEMTYLTFLTVGAARFDAGDMEGAIASLSDAISLSNIPEQMVNAADAYLIRAIVSLMQSWITSGKLSEQALSDINEVIRRKKDYARAYGFRCSANIARKEYSLALKDCDKAIELEPNVSNFYSTRANLYLSMGNVESAIADFSKSLDISKSDPDDLQTYFNCGSLYALKDDFRRAISCLDKLDEFDLPTYVRYVILIEKGALHTETKEYDLAAVELNRAIQIIPQGPFAYWLMGDVFYQKKKYPQAISSYQKAIDLGLDDPQIFEDQGLAYEKADKINEAIDDFSKAIILKPDFDSAYYNRGRLRVAKRELGKAIEDFDQCIKLDPEDVTNYLQRGFARYLNNELDEAIKDYKRAIDLIPNYWQPYYFRAIAYERKGEVDLAIEDYGMTIKLGAQLPDATLADAYFHRGLLYERKSNYNQAIKEYDQAIKTTPDHVLAYLSRGMAHALKAEYDSAVSDLTKVLQLTSDPQIRAQAEKLLNDIRIKQSPPVIQ